MAKRSDKKLAVNYKSVADLVPYARNARTHSDAQIQQIADSIRQFGFLNPVIVDGNNGIIAGHGRVLAASLIGMDAVPTVEASHLSDAQKRAYIIADNKLALNAGWDNEILRSELGALADSGFELGLIGFGDDELADMFGKDYEIEDVATGPVNDEYWISIRGPLKEQAEALRRMQKAMEGLSGTSVDMGTMAIDW